MTKNERKLIKFLTGFFYGVTLFILFGVFMWFYPRTPVKTATEMITDKPSYSVGDVITVKGSTQINMDSKAKFDVRVICDGIKYYYKEIASLTVTKQNHPVKYVFPYGTLPDYIKGHRCKIESVATYNYQVLPLLNRDYFYTFSSNEFSIN